MTQRDTGKENAVVIAISPYHRGLGAVAFGLMLLVLIAAATLFALSGVPGEWLGRYIPFVAPAFWSPVIIALLTYVIMPYVFSLMQRVSRCRSCGKSALVTSEHLDEWNNRANPYQRTAGANLFWPETECSECHADLCKVDR